MKHTQDATADNNKYSIIRVFFDIIFKSLIQSLLYFHISVCNIHMTLLAFSILRRLFLAHDDTVNPNFGFILGLPYV